MSNKTLFTKLLFLLCLMSILFYGHAQNDIHSSFEKWTLNNTGSNEPMPENYQLLQYNAGTNIIASTGSSNNGKTLNHLGINKSGYLYAIEGTINANYNILSYNTKNGFEKLTAKTNVTWDGGIESDARTSGMAIDNNDYGWVVANSVINGNNYVTSFKTSATGTVSDVLNKPYILKTELNAVLVTDIAFDLFNNLYAVVLDVTTGHQYIYYANAQSFTNAVPGGTILLSRIWEITNADNTTAVLNPKYMSNLPVNFPSFDSYMAEGLAFSSNGFLLVSVDKITFNSYMGGMAAQSLNNIYAIRFTDSNTPIVHRSNIYTSLENSGAISHCSDLASNNFPAFMPLTYGDVAATISNDQLNINWDTKSERNNTKFDISISKDGNSFTSIGTINTKAQNGCSNVSIAYNFNYYLNNLSQGFFLPFVMILLALGTLLQKKRKYTAVISCMLILCLYACSKKNNTDGIKKYSGKFFVKITAIDTDGAAISSKVIQTK